mgnify:FL=1
MDTEGKYTLQEASNMPYKTITLATMVKVQHFSNGRIKVLKPKYK